MARKIRVQSLEGFPSLYHFFPDLPLTRSVTEVSSDLVSFLVLLLKDPELWACLQWPGTATRIHKKSQEETRSGTKQLNQHGSARLCTVHGTPVHACRYLSPRLKNTKNLPLPQFWGARENAAIDVSIRHVQAEPWKVIAQHIGRMKPGRAPNAAHSRRKKKDGRPPDTLLGKSKSGKGGSNATPHPSYPWSPNSCWIDSGLELIFML
ncbi:hypothetical protein B0H16DRAFT_1458905 [Mycena metata]|uniref:Uncharacterized protein n=1 Tax=Mycena metata TaxID=1033252 RepID=A0AAD7J4E0_9AGAR|nr:hypothetical protein B0H16DRAFT_1458905 [Mycena metata]